MKIITFLSLGLIPIAFLCGMHYPACKSVDAAEAVKISYQIGVQDGRNSIVLQAIDGELKEITLAKQ